jgi:hypothetical protein
MVNEQRTRELAGKSMNIAGFKRKRFAEAEVLPTLKRFWIKFDTQQAIGVLRIDHVNY